MFYFIIWSSNVYINICIYIYIYTYIYMYIYIYLIYLSYLYNLDLSYAYILRRCKCISICKISSLFRGRFGSITWASLKMVTRFLKGNHKTTQSLSSWPKNPPIKGDSRDLPKDMGLGYLWFSRDPSDVPYLRPISFGIFVSHGSGMGPMVWVPRAPCPWGFCPSKPTSFCCPKFSS